MAWSGQTGPAEVHDGLHSAIGGRRIIRFLNGLAKPFVAGEDFSTGDAAMAADDVWKAEAAS